MLKRRILIVAGIAVLGVLAAQAQERPAAAGEPAPVSGKIVNVTAYRGQALVTRNVPVRKGTGLMDVVVSDLPTYVFGGSLFADGAANVEVRAVRYRTRVVGKDVSSEAAKLQQEIEDIDMRKRENVALTQLADRQLLFLDKLEGFTAPTAATEMSKGVLNAEQIEKLSKFSFEKRAELVKARLALAEAMIKLNKDSQLAQMRLGQLGGGDTRIEREAVIFVDKRVDTESSLNLSYLVGNVNWRPNYNLRAETGKDSVKVEYSALMTQMSGEDWSGVELTLSTASPALVARGAILAPMMITLVPRANSPASAYDVKDAEVWNATRAGLKKSQMDTARAGGGSYGGDTPSAPSDEAAEKRANVEMEQQLNRIADEMQKFEFFTSNEVIRQQRATAEGVSVEYRLPGSTGLASRSDQQLVKISDLNLAAKFAFVGTPIHSDYVYLEGEARNTSETVLLEGPYSAYLDSRFVGRSVLPLVGRGENFTAGFGIDSQLRVSRDLVSKEESIKGGNRVVTYNYRLTLVNYKSADVVIRLIDRMPATQNPDIRINLVKTSEELSKDRLYERDEKPKGILRWDVKVPKGATEADAREITYSFSMEYDKQMELTGK
ncbi:MAG: mucoidy inhibitor MuiA family protein [Planctomycetes bacterium]|nr:mucoidy inhibitor MuiA family protein [Planctomycetota bacterium]